MAECSYTLTGADGKALTLTGIPELKAYLATGGLEYLLPDAKVQQENADDALSPESKIGDTITIDGKERSTTNSNGKPIASTEEGLRNFWRWFGESKVVDESGRPLVVYHGGTADNEFNTSGENARDILSTLGAFFTPDKEVAESFAKDTDGKVTSAYLAIQNLLTPRSNFWSETGIRDNAPEAYDDFTAFDSVLTSASMALAMRHPVMQWVDKPAKERAKLAKGFIAKNGFDGAFLQDSRVDRGAEQFIAFSPNQIKSAIGNTGDFSPDSNDIRYSIVDDWITPSQREFIAKAGSPILTQIRVLADAVRRERLALFTVLQMEEQNADILPGIADYTEPMHRYRTEIDTWLRESDRVVNIWQSLKPEDEKNLTKTMAASTLADVDAARDWAGVTTVKKPGAFGAYVAHTQAKFTAARKDKLIAQAVAISGLTRPTEIASLKAQDPNEMPFRTQEQAQKYLAILNKTEADQTAFRAGRFQDPNLMRHIAHQKVRAAYPMLSEEAKYVYKETHKLHNHLANKKLKILEDRITESIFNGEKRKALNAIVRKKFESNKLSYYYAPLLRFGEHWFYGKTRDGKVWFEMFNNTKDREIAAKKFESEEGTKVERGTTLRNLAVRAAAVGDTFVTDVIQLVDNAGLDKQQAKDLQDNIYQMYLAELPDVSLRHSSQNRKGTGGFDQDFMRAFAYTMHHGASQVANMKEGREMEQALIEMQETQKLAQNEQGQEKLKTEIEAAKLLIAEWDDIAKDRAIEERMATLKGVGNAKTLVIAKYLRNKFRDLNGLRSTVAPMRDLVQNWDSLSKPDAIDALIKIARDTEKVRVLKSVKGLIRRLGSKAAVDAAKDFKKPHTQKALEMLRKDWDALSQPGAVDVMLDAERNTPEVAKLQMQKLFLAKFKNKPELLEAQKAAQLLIANPAMIKNNGVLEGHLKEEQDTPETATLKEARRLLNKFGQEFDPDTEEALDAHIEKMQQRLDRAALIKTDADKTRAANVVGEIGDAYKAMVNTQSSKWDKFAAKIRQVSFMYHLGFGISSGLFNVAQTPVVAMPVIAGRYGWPQTKTELGKAYAEFASAVKMAFTKDANGNYMRDADGNASITVVLEQQQKKFPVNSPQWEKLGAEINFLNDRKIDGTISNTQTHELISVSNGGMYHAGPLYELSQKAGWMFHHGERLNREVTLLTAFRLSQKGNAEMNVQPLNAEDAAVYARKVTNDSHFNYSPENAARIFRGWPSGIAMQFKKYQQAMYYLWGKNIKNWRNQWKAMPENTPEEKEAKAKAKAVSREAYRILAGLFAMQTSVAGFFGLPLMGTVSTVIGGALGLFDSDDDDDKPYDLEKSAREWLTEQFGEDVATGVTKGLVNAITSIDSASRTGLGTLYFQDVPKDMEGGDKFGYWLASLFGASGGMGKSIADGLKLIDEGNYERGAEKILPKFLRDPLQAGRFALEDARSLDGTIKLKDMSPLEVGLKAAGIGSSGLEEKYEYRGYYNDDKRALMKARSLLMRKAARALTEGGELPMEELEAWKRKHPGIPISMQNIRASAKATQRAVTKAGDKGWYEDPKYLEEGEDED